jgi:predicted DNA-binding protein
MRQRYADNKKLAQKMLSRMEIKKERRRSRSLYLSDYNYERLVLMAKKHDRTPSEFTEEMFTIFLGEMESALASKRLGSIK